MSYLQEIGIFATMVWACVIVGTIVLNFQAFIGTIQDTFWWIQQINVSMLNTQDTQFKIWSLNIKHKDYSSRHWSAHLVSDESISQSNESTKKIWYNKDIEQYLRRQFKNIKLSFNLLPPDNYLIIPEIWVQVRLVDTHMVSSDVLAHGDFESYLQQWVVKYPATPDPGTMGNALLFGHTSLEPWKLAKNKYGTVFRNMPKLNAWSKFSVIRNGEKYDYNVVEKAIKKPKEVKDFYAQYKKDNSYVSLMGCYPIWSDAQRIVVVWELADPKLAKTNHLSQNYMAYQH